MLGDLTIQIDFLATTNLWDLVPDDHILKQVDAILDLSWLRDEVRDCYHPTLGRTAIAPEIVLRLMLAGYFLGEVQDRALLRRDRERGWRTSKRTAYRAHQQQLEGVQGEAKEQHGVRRAVRRGTDNMLMQAALTATVINLKRLARANAVRRGGRAVFSLCCAWGQTCACTLWRIVRELADHVRPADKAWQAYAA